jgi:transmembrane sensor
MAIETSVQEQAAAWAVRTGDPEFSEWEAFTHWLEADPGNAAAYDRIMAAVDDVVAAGLPEAAPINLSETGNVVPISTARTSRRGWIGGAVAACLALAVTVGLWIMPGAPRVYETAPGETRQIALADGSTITLGGASRLEMTGPEAREARLEAGQALFSLKHDDDVPFELAVGEDRLVDIGTVFDVRRAGTVTTVAVAEGAVLFDPARRKVRINPGQRLVHADGTEDSAVEAYPAALVGEWREGRLTFRDATLGEIADDLSRATGVRFATRAGAAERRISGSVLLDPVRADPASLGPLLGVSMRRQGQGWMIEP